MNAALTRHRRLGMTSIDGLASDRPATAKRNVRRARSVLLAVPLTLSLMVPTAAFAAVESTTGYSQTPPPPTTKTTPKPTKGTAPSTAIGTPVTIKPSAPAPKSTLPFTGLDLRLVIGLGIVMLAMGGLSIRVIQRRQQSGGWRSL
jgi:hypothetical protein